MVPSSATGFHRHRPGVTPGASSPVHLRTQGLFPIWKPLVLARLVSESPYTSAKIDFRLTVTRYHTMNTARGLLCPERGLINMKKEVVPFNASRDEDTGRRWFHICAWATGVVFR